VGIKPSERNKKREGEKNTDWIGIKTKTSKDSMAVSWYA
jgi:hypothetical protein